MKITAVIPVRKGSQRVKNKNTKPFADTTLLDLKIQVMKQVHGLDAIIVNTNCETCISIAKNHNIETHKREEYFASSQAKNSEYWTHIAEVTNTDVLVMAEVTNPMVRVSSYEQAIIDYIKTKDQYTSAMSVSSQKQFLWQNGSPINYDYYKTPNSQDLPNIVSLNFAITISSKQEILKTGNVVSASPKFIELDSIQSIDIDTPVDFEYAEFMYKKQGFKWLLS